jgi:hypothetical protein
MDQNSIWELRGVFGTERWTFAGGKAVSIDLGARHIEAKNVDAERDLLALRTGGCGCAQYWPNAFGFCPECGIPLNAPETSGQGVWPLPFGTAGGVPEWDGVPAVDRSPSVWSQPDAKLPVEAMPLEGSSLQFVVAGTPARLYAIERLQGDVNRWVRTPGGAITEGRWLKCSDAGRTFKLPAWSWSAAASARGFAIPTDSGPVWLRCLPSEPYAVVKPGEALGIQACVSGCALSDGLVFVPVRTTSGLAVACFDEAVGGWTVLPVAGGQACAEDAFFAAPSASGRDIFWTSPAGYICVTDKTAVYLTWADGFTAECGFRPYLHKSSEVLFQLGGYRDELRFVSLVPAAALPEFRHAEGYSISAGHSIFREGLRYQSPDAAAHFQQFRLREGEYVLPLLNFSDETLLFAACSNRLELSSFFSVEEAGPRRRCALHFGMATYLSPPLNVVAEASAPWDLIPFVYDGAVFVYSRHDNKCWCWNAGLKQPQ